MKIKLITLLTGAVAFTLASTPFVVKSVAATPVQSLLAQATTPARLGTFTNLNLTTEQQDQIKKLHEETRQKIEAVLTPKQQEQYRSVLQNRRTQMRDRASGDRNSAPNSASLGERRQQNVLATLNLSKQQRDQIREIMQSSREQMKTILTDTQQEQLQQLRRSNMRNRTR
ncbi:MAG TPA: hypothetical protein V6D14_13910 [Coleofasciculaceae cyanobacterium]|jgi:Spy/CpxP family protein refolding chaperone